MESKSRKKAFRGTTNIILYGNCVKYIQLNLKLQGVQKSNITQLSIIATLYRTRAYTA